MQESTDATRLGLNRTGMQMSPHLSQEMIEGVNALLDPDAEQTVPEGPDGQALSVVRVEYIAAADSLGSVPAPATLKGAAKSSAKMLTGHRPQAFIDKLAERLAFERGGTRLYDAVFAKVIAQENERGKVSAQEILEIRDAEARHAMLIKECMETLGADPTSQTPCADLVGVETMGLLQAVSDPRTTLAQTLHAVVAAELIDCEGWENLIAMAEQIGQRDMAERFRGALDEEGVHLEKVRHWYTELSADTAQLF